MKPLFAFISLLACLAPFSHAQSEAKIASVDALHIYRNYWKTSDLIFAIEQRKKEAATHPGDALIVELYDQIQKLRAEYNSDGVSDERKAEIELLAEDSEAERIALVEEVNDAKRQTLVEISEDLSSGMLVILDEIRAVIDDLAEETGVELVYDTTGKSSTQVPVLVYSRSTIDLTAAVINKLNENAPKEDDTSETSAPAQE